MKTNQVRVKTSRQIIAEDCDENYFHQMLFPMVSLAEQQEQNNPTDIRYSFYDDIALKYNLCRDKIGWHLKIYSLEILRSLVVFGEHEYIIEELRAKRYGSF